MIFENRSDAGRKLGNKLTRFAGPDTLVIGLPRGGVIVAARVAERLNAPLSIIVPRKIGHPDDKEFAIAAVTDQGHLVRNVAVENIDPKWFEGEAKRQRTEARRRRRAYMGRRKHPSFAGKRVIVVDDGLATGLTVVAAIREIQAGNPKQIIVAVPVGAAFSTRLIKGLVDKVVVLFNSRRRVFYVSRHYRHWGQTRDQHVIAALRRVRINR